MATPEQIGIKDDPETQELAQVARDHLRDWNVKINIAMRRQADSIFSNAYRPESQS
jgi:hypothetical protein